MLIISWLSDQKVDSPVNIIANTALDTSKTAALCEQKKKRTDDVKRQE